MLLIISCYGVECRLLIITKDDSCRAHGALTSLQLLYAADRIIPSQLQQGWELKLFVFSIFVILLSIFAHTPALVRAFLHTPTCVACTHIDGRMTKLNMRDWSSIPLDILFVMCLFSPICYRMLLYHWTGSEKI